MDVANEGIFKTDVLAYGGCQRQLRRCDRAVASWRISWSGWPDVAAAFRTNLRQLESTNFCSLTDTSHSAILAALFSIDNIFFQIAFLALHIDGYP